MSTRRGGIISLNINGVLYDCKGNFTYSLGLGLREGIVGADRPHGFKETPQIPYIEGEITDRKDLKLKDLLSLTEATATLSLANGKTVVLSRAYYAGDGVGNTEEGNIQLRLEGETAEEI
ncbi:putative tail tube protein [Myxococcus stipitatus DSM 14675]|uniref:Putative tail tube protein n=1 Tax=Myxococcus stipitatus (strain DSM 14675 / JCM 12634 / Mx s8) TaxID=1278073 RepID=L7U394_MYXSD|nr:phage tail tube protein [Myxococcus stipitatus]AGC43256.1 putative tail tube protein [Myxococcus stipitatus DSM 14675]